LLRNRLALDAGKIRCGPLPLGCLVHEHVEPRLIRKGGTGCVR
jgi:hypothetical protein